MRNRPSTICRRVTSNPQPPPVRAFEKDHLSPLQTLQGPLYVLSSSSKLSCFQTAALRAPQRQLPARQAQALPGSVLNIFLTSLAPPCTTLYFCNSLPWQHRAKLNKPLTAAMFRPLTTAKYSNLLCRIRSVRNRSIDLNDFK